MGAGVTISALCTVGDSVVVGGAGQNRFSGGMAAKFFQGKGVR